MAEQVRVGSCMHDCNACALLMVEMEVAMLVRSLCMCVDYRPTSYCRGEYMYTIFTPIFKGVFLRMLQRQGANQLALASPNYLPMQLVCTLPWQSCLLVSFMWDFFSLYWYSSSWNVMQQ